MVTIKFFAQLRERLSCDELNYAIDAPVTIGWLRDQLCQKGDEWQRGLAANTILMAVNHKMCSEKTIVNDGDEVAFFPPVTGG